VSVIEVVSHILCDSLYVVHCSITAVDQDQDVQITNNILTNTHEKKHKYAQERVLTYLTDTYFVRFFVRRTLRNITGGPRRLQLRLG
jgi:hypothetical protein